MKVLLSVLTCPYLAHRLVMITRQMIRSGIRFSFVECQLKGIKTTWESLLQ